VLWSICNAIRRADTAVFRQTLRVPPYHRGIAGGGAVRMRKKAAALHSGPWPALIGPVGWGRAPGRGGLYAERILQGFGGILQARSHGLLANHEREMDGYACNNRLISADHFGPGIHLTYCWAHAPS
jgi:hypothetical protein